MMRFDHAAMTDVGQVRTLNEDAVLASDDLFAVADGMGGHRGGEVASATALGAFRSLGDVRTPESLISGVEGANRAVFDMSISNPNLSGMGTTLCAMAPLTSDQPTVGVVNVGDSRVYLLSGNDFVQVSEDHSLVETLVRGGQLTPDEAAVHPKRNVLTRALGIEAGVDVDCWVVSPRSGDRFLLCSDGLFNEVSDGEIEAVLRATPEPATAAASLVTLANEHGGRDNISVVIVDVIDAGDDSDGTVAGRVTRVSDPIDDPLGLMVSSTSELPAGFADQRVGPTRGGLGEGDSDTDSGSADGDPADGDPADGDPAAAALGDGPEDRRSRTVRTTVFVVAIVAVFGLAFGSVWWAARSGYFLHNRGGKVVIVKGRDLLWFEPTTARALSLSVGDLSESERADVMARKEFDSLAAAQKWAAGVQRRVDDQAAVQTTTTSPTSTTVASTTTTFPTSVVPTSPPAFSVSAPST